MASTIVSATKKKAGRPATGVGTPVMVRLQPRDLSALDAYAASGEPLTRPQAIRAILANWLSGRSKVRMMLPVQCKMARVAVGIGIRELAQKAKVAPDTVARFERGEDLKPPTVEAVRIALEAAGVIFVEENGEGPGVRLRKQGATKRYFLIANLDGPGDQSLTKMVERIVEKRTVDHPEPSGPATHVIKRMEAEIADGRQKPGRKL